jgi:electron-transferring-flavoprotein dehydrogenase
LPPQIARQTLFAEGARGSCAEELMQRFDLRAGRDPQSFGLGLKEVWRVPKALAQPGLIQHTLGWPLSHNVYGGSFLYHMAPDLVLLGLVVGLDYANPFLSPYSEFQRWKHHPAVRKHIEGGECIQYGARVINEGGLQAVPKLTFPGGALVGCSAGFVNVPKIKGTHTAMKSGMLAADAVADALAPAPAAGAGAGAGASSGGAGLELTAYQAALERSWVWEELRGVRNYHPSFKLGLVPGMLYSGLSAFVLKGREPWTFRNRVADSAKTAPAVGQERIAYPKPDGVLSFDLLTNLARSGTNHEADQPPHLRVRAGMADVPTDVSLGTFGAPESRFCPAKVYEYVDKKCVALAICARQRAFASASVQMRARATSCCR